MSNINGVNNNSEGQEREILTNISKLQTMEKELYIELELNKNTGNSASIINRINQLSQIRISLYKTLNNLYKSLQKNVNTSRTELVELITAVNITEEELNGAKQQLNKLYEIKHSKMRMVEINTYYGKEYKAHSSLMKLIIIVSVVLLILLILRKKSFIPESVANILLGLSIAIGGFLIVRHSLDIYWRDNMNFDEYEWDFDPNTQKPSVYEYDREQIFGTIDDSTNTDIHGFNGVDCIGDACCSKGMEYDSKNRKCIENVAPETFVTGQLTKHCFNNKSRINTQSDNNNPMPYGGEEIVNFASV